LAIICDPALVLRAPDPARVAPKKSAKDTKAPARKSKGPSGPSTEDRQKVKDLKQREVDEQGDFVMDRPQGPRERSEEAQLPLEDTEMEDRIVEATPKPPFASTSVRMALDARTEGGNSETEVATALGASSNQVYVLIVVLERIALKSVRSCSIVTFDSLGSHHKPVGRALKAYLANEARDKDQVAPDAEVSAEEARDAYVNVRLFLSFCRGHHLTCAARSSNKIISAIAASLCCSLLKSSLWVIQPRSKNSNTAKMLLVLVRIGRSGIPSTFGRRRRLAFTKTPTI
jgi:hypothetical protein